MVPQRTIRAAALFLAASLLATPAEADEAAIRAAWVTEQERVAGALRELAAWATEAKIYGSRAEALELLLLYAPDDEDARKRLRYTRDEAGRWVRGRYKPPHNLRGGKDVQAFSERLAAIGDEAWRQGEALLDAHGEAVPPGLVAEIRRLTARTAAHKAAAREANGEVRDGEAWVLLETHRARIRRDELARLARGALDGVPAPRSVKTSWFGLEVLMPWKGSLGTVPIRVTGTVPRSEVQEAVRVGHATRTLFGDVFPDALTGKDRIGFYLLTGAKEAQEILDAAPWADDAFRTWAVQLDSFWQPGEPRCFVADDDGARRLEWVSRQTVVDFLKRRFGVQSKHGWAFEGFGLYLTHLVTGRRTTWFVRATGYGTARTAFKALWKKLANEKTDWRAEALRVLTTSETFDLALLLGKAVDTMTAEDLVVSYALAAYLLEGLTRSAPGYLVAIGAGDPWDEALAKGLGLDFAGLAARLVRWLEETGQ